MSDYTKVTIKKSVYEVAKIAAALENRSAANYIEHLVLVTDLKPSDSPKQLQASQPINVHTKDNKQGDV